MGGPSFTVGQRVLLKSKPATVVDQKCAAGKTAVRVDTIETATEPKHFEVEAKCVDNHKLSPLTPSQRVFYSPTPLPAKVKPLEVGDLVWAIEYDGPRRGMVNGVATVVAGHCDHKGEILLKYKERDGKLITDEAPQCSSTRFLVPGKPETEAERLARLQGQNEEEIALDRGANPFHLSDD